jgi:hypothetical protein
MKIPETRCRQAPRRDGKPIVPIDFERKGAIVRVTITGRDHERHQLKHDLAFAEVRKAVEAEVARLTSREFLRTR